jgi:hypothetical protein
MSDLHYVSGKKDRLWVRIITHTGRLEKPLKQQHYQQMLVTKKRLVHHTQYGIRHASCSYCRAIRRTCWSCIELEYSVTKLTFVYSQYCGLEGDIPEGEVGLAL